MTKALEKASTAVLRQWMFSDAHFLHPYPTPRERDDLARRAQLTPAQVKNWFINARKRLWQPLLAKFDVAASPQTGTTRISHATWRSLQPLLRRLRSPEVCPSHAFHAHWASQEEAALALAITQTFLDGRLDLPAGTEFPRLLRAEMPRRSRAAVAAYVRAAGLESAKYTARGESLCELAKTRAHLNALRAKVPGDDDDWDVIEAVIGNISEAELDKLLYELSDGDDDD
ncbi:hypothetical protein ACHHYP_08068 [Achlya hypogyna]|uniref:Homeobox domain-containing protein n=1 Tax=Achlya hypogyna TaxID=1202772 RepID=A0A1V9YPU0_ACHHY|nr:hypothetical protein ACHHYP_08068 [Achlya hypogyna]